MKKDFVILKNTFLFSTMLFFIIQTSSSCKKNECALYQSQKIVDTIFFDSTSIDSTISDSSFIIGVNSELIDIIVFDSVVKIISPFHEIVNKSFDIDHDGILDIKIESFSIASPGGIGEDYSTIEVLNHNFEISYSSLIDSGFSCYKYDSDSTLYLTHYNNQYEQYEYFNCDGEKIFRNTHSTLSPKVYKKSDTLNHLEIWSNSVRYLAYFDHSLFFDDINGGHTKHKIKRGLWDKTNMKYLIFRINRLNQYYYGWLKLSVEETREIRFYEYALQKYPPEI